jgi:penicillin-binding protein 1C
VRLGYKLLAGAAAVFLMSVLLAPMPSFHEPLSTVVEAADGSLLGARAAADGQWRFPSPDSVPDKYVTALINYEDRWFRWHPGINPVAIMRAMKDNISAREIVSGGSTITMQVARLARHNPPRTYTGKIIEMLSALKLELFRSKNTILKLYAANAPFGGNTVGLDAASWRYTGRSPWDMTWAEAAAFAVLPNAPSLVYPGKNSVRFRQKRDSLLVTLCRRGIIDSLTLSLAIDEPLPNPAGTMPSLAPHLVSWFAMTHHGERVRTTIDPFLQKNITDIINSHQKELENNLIYNSAAIIVRVDDGAVLAYAGNCTLPDSTGNYCRDVDIIRSVRSTGSILKPFLYAALVSSGEMLPNELIADVPTRFQGFRPENSDLSYRGAVMAGDALARSLNIPAVRMLQRYTEERFLRLLTRTGFTSFTMPASHYGLSLILGGGEASLWELAGAYSSMARVEKQCTEKAIYTSHDWHVPVFSTSAQASPAVADPDPPLSAPAIWLTYEALLRVNRPETETGWQYFGNAPAIAWKTGTSFGFRDAWAIGTTPSEVIAVWAGNADGEGRPGLTGITAAAPILFDIFRTRPHGSWFRQPQEEMTTVSVCTLSGMRAGPYCTETRDEWIPVKGLKSNACPYHTIVHLDKTEKYRVNMSCVNPGNIINKPWFILPPAMEYYYKMRNPSYQSLPPFKPGCNNDREVSSMEFLYPPPGAKIFIPRGFTGELTEMLPEVAHRRRNAIVYWHLDNNYLGMTKGIHQISLRAQEGEHLLTVTDDEGFTVSRSFSIVSSAVR